MWRVGPFTFAFLCVSGRSLFCGGKTEHRSTGGSFRVYQVPRTERVGVEGVVFDIANRSKDLVARGLVATACMIHVQVDVF